MTAFGKNADSLTLVDTNPTEVNQPRANDFLLGTAIPFLPHVEVSQQLENR